MKFNTRTISIIGALVFVVAFAVLYMNYSNRQNELKTENQNLTSVKSNLTKLQGDKTNLNNQLAQVNSQITQLQNELLLTRQALEQKKQSFPLVIDSVNYGVILFDAADRFNVDILNISTNGSQINKVDNITLSTISFTLSLQGNLDDLQNLIHALANEEPFRSATIETTNLNMIEGTVTGTSAGGTTIPIATAAIYHTMDLQITIYGNKGG